MEELTGSYIEISSIEEMQEASSLLESKGYKNPYTTNDFIEGKTYLFIGSNGLFHFSNGSKLDFWKPFSVLKNTEENLLEKAKKDYPIGTVVKCPILSTETTITGFETDLRNNKDTIYFKTSNNRVPVLHNGKWIPIISKPKEPSKIDSWCVQVTEENREVVKNYLKDSYLSYTLGGYYGITKDGITKDGSKKWSLYFDKILSTEEFYEKIGHKSKEKSLVGRWLKALINNPNGGDSVKKGDYGIISDVIHNSPTKVDFPNHKNYYIEYLASDKYELMPEGFTPPQEKEYGYEVVHCTTQQEWDFVRSKTTSENSKEWIDAILGYENIGIALRSNGKGWASLNFYKKDSCKILSFKEWCDKFGHKPDFNEIPEYVECIVVPLGWGPLTKLGNIYKTDKYPTGGYRILYEEGGGQMCLGVEHCFKPSTKEAYEAQQKPKFETGKWYKYKNHIGKFLEYKNGIFVVSEWIYKGKYYNYNSNWGCNKEDYLREIVTDLSEIQQYLPEGHSDKFPPAAVKEWSIGSYLVVIKEGYCGHNQCLKHYNQLPLGLVGKIQYDYDYESSVTAIENNPVGTYVIEKELAKWFATKEEAEAFSKELLHQSVELEPIGKKIESYEKVPLPLSGKELLAEAKRRYPVGTKVKCLTGWSPLGEIITSQQNYSLDNDFEKIWFKGIYNILIYSEGKWAEIISVPEESKDVVDLKTHPVTPEQYFVQNDNYIVGIDPYKIKNTQSSNKKGTFAPIKANFINVKQLKTN